MGWGLSTRVCVVCVRVCVCVCVCTSVGAVSEEQLGQSLEQPFQEI